MIFAIYSLLSDFFDATPNSLFLFSVKHYVFYVLFYYFCIFCFLSSFRFFVCFRTPTSFPFFTHYSTICPSILLFPFLPLPILRFPTHTFPSFHRFIISTTTTSISSFINPTFYIIKIAQPYHLHLFATHFNNKI